MNEEEIGREIDNLGQEVVLYFCKDTNIPREVNSFFLRKVADLVETGHAPENFLPTLKDTRIIYVKINNEIAAHLIWNWIGTETYIVFTAISEKYERRGLYKIMHRYYEERIKAGGATASHSTLRVTNKRIVDISKINGYQIEYYKMVKKL